MDEEKKIQRVKIVGPLFVIKSVLGIIRDVLLIIFLITLIFGIITVAQVAEDFDPEEFVAGIMPFPGESDNNINPFLKLVEDLEKAYEEGEQQLALQKVQEIETLAQRSGTEEKELEFIPRLRRAIEQRNDLEFYEIMTSLKSEVSRT